MTTVGDVIENALYLSLKDRYFDIIPTPKEPILLQQLGRLNRILDIVSKRNPATGKASIDSNLFQMDSDMMMTYADLSATPFSTIASATYSYSGGTLSLEISEVGLKDFFRLSSVRTLNTYPAWCNYDVFLKRFYIYPTPSIQGNLILFGKAKIGPFTGVDESFPSSVSEAFIEYFTYYLAKNLCAEFNAPWQAQKEEMLKIFKKEVENENRTDLQRKALPTTSTNTLIRNTRIGL